MQDFNDFILENKVIGFFEEPIKLASGRYSNFYINWRTIVEDVYLTEKLADYLLNYLVKLIQSKQLLEPNTIFGVAEGASKIGIISQYLWAKRSASYAPRSHMLAMGRGKPKEHGALKDKLFVGEPTGKVLVVEDVTTTGGSLIKCIDSLVDAGIDVIGSVGLTNRMELRDDGLTVKEAIESRWGGRIKYYSMSQADELLPQAFKMYGISDELKIAVIKELAIKI